jgi:hypothetical protein
MNNLGALRPVTRRAIPLFYKSPGICELPTPFSGSSVPEGGTSIPIVPVTRKAGPDSLEAVVVGVDVSLNWPSVSYIFAYAVYRATNPEGPFTLLTSNLGENSFVDFPGSGQFYYKVTGVEPDFGETFPSPLVGVTV